VPDGVEIGRDKNASEKKRDAEKIAEPGDLFECKTIRISQKFRTGQQRIFAPENGDGVFHRETI
jgi:hypothetical protein